MPVPVLLSVLSLDGGGSERQFRQTAKALDRSRFEVHAAFFRPGGARQQELESAGVRTLYLPLYSYLSKSAFDAVAGLKRYCREHKIQVAHSFDNPSSILAVPAARMARVPVVLSSLRAHRNVFSFRYRNLQRLTDRLADAIVVNSEALRKHLVRGEGMCPDRVRICPNGLDTGQFYNAPRARPAEWREDWREDAKAVIGCVAAHRPEKNLPFLVDAFAAMRRMRPGLKLVLVGSGPDTPAIEERVSANDLGADCKIIPHVETTTPWLHAIDIFVLASDSEGASNSLVEAMACGCAVVASKVDGTREMVEDGRTGLLFALRDQSDLVSKVLRLVDDEPLRSGIAGNASAWAASSLSIEASAERMAAIYDEFLSRPPKTARSTSSTN